MSVLSAEMARREEEEGLFSRDIDGRLVRMDKVTAEDLDRDITLKIDGQPVTVKKAVPKTDAQGNILKDAAGLVIPRATTIYDAATLLFEGRTSIGSAGIPANPIPILCHREHMEPVAVCRLCVVEISKVKRGKMQAERKLLPACQHRVEETMEVASMATSQKVRDTVKTLTELLMADHPSPCSKQGQTGDCELEALAKQFEVREPRFSRRTPRPKDDSSLVIAVDHDACIMCDRCIRGCNDIRNNQVIGRANKGYKAQIAFDLNDPMGNSSCVACGECMISCPTGALTNKLVVGAAPWEDATPRPEKVAAEELIHHPNDDIRHAFRGTSPAFLRWNESSIVRRRFKKGQIICREGEFGSSAFMIESGTVDIYLSSSLDHVKNTKSGGLFGFAKKLTVNLVSRRQDHREDESERNYISIDAPVALAYARPAASLGPGDIFGEMTCMNSYPRSATVSAAEDCTVLEVLRNVLYLMQRSRAFRVKLEEKYRARAIDNHLRSVNIFATIRRDEAQFNRFVDGLRQTVRLTRRDPGEVIFRQGDRSEDGFYLVRTGFVKVSQMRPGGEHVLSYVGPGGYFGEIALMSEVPEVRALAPPGLRTATCSALDHVDLVQIKAADFREVLKEFPQVREPLIAEAIKRLEENAAAAEEGREPPAGRVPQPGPDEREQPARARPPEMHPMRRMHQGLRRRPRRRDPTHSRGPAVRQIPRGQLLPILPRPLLHGRLPGGCDPPSRVAGDAHRGLVHRLREVRRELPVRQHQHALVRHRQTHGRSRKARQDDGRSPAKGHALRPLPGRGRATQLRLRLPARRRASHDGQGADRVGRKGASLGGCMTGMRRRPKSKSV